MENWNSTDYTFSDSKYSCFAFLFYPHVILSYLIVLSGLFAFITRFCFTWLHSWMGRIYIMLMLWNVALSLLIHNTGLPLGVIISFIYVLGGLSLGWIFIGIHKDIRPILDTSIRRIFSWKSMHGIFMFLSWINIAGRVPFGNIVQDFRCHTYPIDKTTGELVSVIDPRYDRLPWANSEGRWALMLGGGPILAALLICIIYVLTSRRRINKNLIVSSVEVIS